MNLKPIQQLLETDMDRKEFLMYLGAALLTVVGISGLVKSLTQPKGQATSKRKAGYGSSSYGG